MTKRKGRKKTTVKKVEEEQPEVKVKQKPKVEEEQPKETYKRDLRNISLSDFPEVGELVVGMCTKITTHGAYFNLEGYDILGKSAGFVHISELSRTWVRNIRKHVREGQKSVCRVMRVNIQRQEIDLSIRRVTESQKRETLQIHKQEQRARGIIKSVLKSLEISDDTLIPRLESIFGNLYSCLERARDDGPSELIKSGINEKIAEELASAASRELERSTVSLLGNIQLSTIDPNGNEVIKRSFIDAIDVTIKKKALKVQVNVVSAPDYKVIIDAGDWKIAEKCWVTFQESIKKYFKKNSKSEPLLLSFVRE